MGKAGFTNYGTELWHFSAADHYDALMRQQPHARYGQLPGGSALPEGAGAGALRGAATRGVVRGDWQDCDHECHSCHSATADRRRRGLSSTGSAGPHGDPSAPPPWGADVA
nr:hypothetical protein [Streptomyces sp. NA03103]